MSTLFLSSLGISDGKMWASGIRLSPRCLLDDADFLVCQAVEFVDELVDLFVGGVDLALDERFLVVCLGNLKALVELWHTFHKVDEAVVVVIFSGL